MVSAFIYVKYTHLLHSHGGLVLCKWRDQQNTLCNNFIQKEAYFEPITVLETRNDQTFSISTGSPTSVPVVVAHGKVILMSICCLSLVDVPDKAPDRVQLETPGYDSPTQTEDTQGAR